MTKPPLLLLFLGVIFLSAVSRVRADEPADSYELLSGQFRSVIDAEGRVIPDEGLWEVGPAPGEVAHFARFGVKLDGVSAKTLKEGPVGVGYKDQHGGRWETRRIQVMFKNDLTRCEAGSSERFACIFLVPAFGGYKLDRKRWEDGRIVGALTPAEGDSIRRAQEEVDAIKHVAYLREEKARKARGQLMPTEQTHTPMFRTLTAAIRPFVDSGVSPSKGEFCHFTIQSDAAGLNMTFTRTEGWDDKAPEKKIAAVPMSALTAAGFEYLPQYRSIRDPKNPGYGLYLDPYVIGEAACQAAAGAAQARKSAALREKGDGAVKIGGQTLP
ncbi:MAG: hypothetical protein HY077_00530 [Elusimicrobia bacterium]|nr:hypothetical protein [Elusimicrobiota bacterium]